jgi:hypothetical protein
MPQNTFQPFSKNTSRLKKWWITKVIDDKNKIIESGSFNQSLYEKFKQIVNTPVCYVKK